jgi:hypothetical protein
MLLFASSSLRAECPDSFGCFSKFLVLTGRCPVSPALQAGSRGTMQNDITLPGSPALWAGSFKYIKS